MYFHDASAQWRVLHTADVIGKKHHLAVANVGDETCHTVKETRVGNLLLVTNAPVLQVFLPRSAERRVADAEVKLLACMTIWLMVEPKAMY